MENHVAIITGSARGFGKEFAIRLLEKGGKVCISDVNTELGLQTLKELQEKYGQEYVTFCKCDVAVAEDWQSLWTHAEQTFDCQVTLLVNNAGLQTNWQKSLDIMLYGVCHGTWLAIDKMSVTKGGTGGRIVNIASMAGFLEGMRNIDEAGYTMAKSAVVTLTRSFAQRGRNGPWKQHGIKAFALCPWFADTQLLTDAGIDTSAINAKTKQRNLTIAEVGDAFTEALRLDSTGACYAVIPDCPIFDYRNPNFVLLFAMTTFGQTIGRALSLRSYCFRELFIFIVILMFLSLMLLYLFIF